jgi:hypothetical protein
MAVLKPRNRLVYFRVSEEEFQLFTNMCQAEGARSISDLARVALQRLAHERATSTEVKVNSEGVFFETLRLITEALNELRQINCRLNSGAPENGKQQSSPSL